MTIKQLKQYRHIKGKMLLLEAEKDELILRSKAVDEGVIGGTANG